MPPATGATSKKFNARTKRRLYEHTAAAVYNEPWLLMPEKLEAICGLLARREAGVEGAPSVRPSDCHHPRSVAPREG